MMVSGERIDKKINRVEQRVQKQLQNSYLVFDKRVNEVKWIKGSFLLYGYYWIFIERK